MVRLTPKRSPSESSGSFAPGSSACSMMARRSARQITPTLSDDSAFLPAGGGAIVESPQGSTSNATSYHEWSTVERLNCMQFDGRIAQIESADSDGFLQYR